VFATRGSTQTHDLGHYRKTISSGKMLELFDQNVGEHDFRLVVRESPTPSHPLESSAALAPTASADSPSWAQTSASETLSTRDATASA
jgi:hypothetical protein